jgi:hypothetical protein
MCLFLLLVRFRFAVRGGFVGIWFWETLGAAGPILESGAGLGMGHVIILFHLLRFYVQKWEFGGLTNIRKARVLAQ